MFGNDITTEYRMVFGNNITKRIDSDSTQIRHVIQARQWLYHPLSDVLKKAVNALQKFLAKVQKVVNI
jgi:hypothetical protein